MIRKLVVVLLTGVMCLVGITSALAVTYNEAPMLRTLVAAGELPPVEERLPEDPMVVEPPEGGEIGQYGGTVRELATSSSAGGWYPASQIGYETLGKLNRRLTEVIPNIVKGWEFSEDGKVFTLYLRKGLKWSDGFPFTADDIMFWWEDKILNDEVTPVISKDFTPGGKLMEVGKIDDYTVRFSSIVPYYTILLRLGGVGSGGGQSDGYLPKHALKKYHIKYNPDANELAKKEGYENWFELFDTKQFMNRDNQRWPEIPVLNAWITKVVKPDMILWERNPYYFKVDPAGNQLPYIDQKIGIVAGTRELFTMKVLTGQVDFDPGVLGLPNYSLLKENEEKGNYRAWLGPGGWGSECALVFNQTYDEEDPVLAKILRDIRFRRALSVVINREEINETVFYGFATPRQVTINPDASFYKEEFGNTYAEYAPDEASGLLDEMGLKWDKNHEWRLRPDGETLSIVITFWANCPGATPQCELAKEYWEDIGVRTILNSVERSYLWDMQEAHKYQVFQWVGDGTTEAWFYRASYPSLTSVAFAKWWLWFRSDGEEGVEPSEEAKRLLLLTKKIFITTGEEREQVAEEIWRIWSQNVWTIGTVGLAPKACMAKNGLGNVDEGVYGDLHDNGGGQAWWAEMWYWKK